MSFNAKEFSSQFPCYPWLDVVEKAYKEGFEAGKKEGRTEAIKEILTTVEDDESPDDDMRYYLELLLKEVSE